MRAGRLAVVAVALALVAGCTPTPTVSTPAPQQSTVDAVDYSGGRSDPVPDPVYPDYGNASLDVLGYRLALTWKPDDRELTGTATLVIRAVKAVDRLTLDFSSSYRVDGVTLDGAATTSRFVGDDLVVPATLAADARTTLVVRYHGRPRPVDMPSARGDFAEGLGLRTTIGGEAWTMQEPYGASTWYPANDLVSDEALYDVAITVPSGWSGVAHGQFLGMTSSVGGSMAGDTFAWRSTDPVAAYLATLAVGKYTRIEDTGPHGLPLTYWLRTARDETYEPVARRTPELLTWLEQRFGPYPFPSAGVVFVDSESAMETQQMVTFGASSALAAGEQDEAAETLLHEYAHQWFGDAVTPTDWTGTWLNEGFAMYSEILWTIEQGMVPAELWLSTARRLDASSRTTAGPPGHPRADHFAEPNVYFGPALMLREIQHAVGDEAFFAFARDWVQTQRNHQVDRAGFTRFVNQHTGRDLTALIDAWLDSPTTPPST